MGAQQDSSCSHRYPRDPAGWDERNAQGVADERPVFVQWLRQVWNLRRPFGASDRFIQAYSAA